MPVDKESRIDYESPNNLELVLGNLVEDAKWLLTYGYISALTRLHAMFYHEVSRLKLHAFFLKTYV